MKCPDCKVDMKPQTVSSFENEDGTPQDLETVVYKCPICMLEKELEEEGCDE
jgi:hypothetical protein